MADTSVVASAPSRALFSALLLALTAGLLTLTLAVPKYAYAQGFTPLVFLFVAATLTAVMLWIVATLAGQMPQIRPAHLRYGLIAGLLTVAAPFGLLFVAIPHVGTGFVTLVGALPPIITYIMAVGLKLERFHWLRALGVLVGMAGVIILGWSKLDLATAEPVWVFLPLLVPVIVACANQFRARAWPTGATALQLAPLMLGGAALWLGLFLAVFDHTSLIPRGANGYAALSLAVQIAMMTALYIMYFVLQLYAGTIYFSQIGSVSAIFGAPLAVIWFGEILPPAIIPAAILLAVGVACVTLGQQLVQRKV